MNRPTARTPPRDPNNRQQTAYSSLSDADLWGKIRVKPGHKRRIEAGGDAGRLLGRSGPKLWCHLSHEQSEAAGRRLVRQRAEAEGRNHAADAERSDFGNRLGDPRR